MARKKQIILFIVERMKFSFLDLRKYHGMTEFNYSIGGKCSCKTFFLNLTEN